MLQTWRELLQYRFLLKQLVILNLKVRYKNSVLGFLWTLLNPLFMMLVFTVLFTIMLPQAGVPNFPLFVLVALLPWQFFSNSVLMSTTSILANANLIKKVYFPREVLPLSTVLANLANFALALVVLFGMMVVLKGPFTVWLVLLPVIIAVQLIFTLGFAFFLSTATIFYRDVPMILDVLMLAWFFLTPIFYPISILPQSREVLGIVFNVQRLAYILNPMASLVASYRVILYGGAPPAWDFLLRTTVTAIAFLIGGYLFFNHFKSSMAEEL